MFGLVSGFVRPSHFALWVRYRLQVLLDHFQTSHVYCRWWEEESYWFWVMGQLRHSVFKTLLALCSLWFYSNHSQTSHESCGWIEEESYWFWVIASKIKVNFGTLCIKPCGRDTDCSLSQITFKLHTKVVDDERRKSEEPYLIWFAGSRVKVNFGTLCIKPCSHNTGYSFCLITFKLHLQVVDNERRNPMDFGSRGQRSSSTWALCV